MTTCLCIRAERDQLLYYPVQLYAEKRRRKKLQIQKRLLPVSPEGVQLEYDALLLRRDLASLEVGPQVVHPPEPAALPCPVEACTYEHEHTQRKRDCVKQLL